MAEQLYALEKLYEDQEPDLVSDTIPAVLAWLGRAGEDPALSFSVRTGAKPAKEDTSRSSSSAPTSPRPTSRCGARSRGSRSSYR